MGTQVYDPVTLRTLASELGGIYGQAYNDHLCYGALRKDQIELCAEREVTRADKINPYGWSDINAKVEQQRRLFTPMLALEQAFAKAKDSGLKQPRIELLGFYFKLATDKARPENQGAIFVTHASNEQYLGKIMKGKFFPSRECTEPVRRSVEDAMEEPEKATREYGFATGKCGICSLPLSNPESVRLGIGPVCRKRFGWV